MQVDLCGVAGAEPRDADTKEVKTLLDHGCRKEAARCIDRNMRERIMSEVTALAYAWKMKDRPRFSDQFDAMARVILQERIRANGSSINQQAAKQADRQYATQAASGQAKATEGAKASQAKRS